MNRYLIRNEQGWLKIIYGDYIKACKQSKNGEKVKTIPDHITDDDIWYGRVTFDNI